MVPALSHTSCVFVLCVRRGGEKHAGRGADALAEPRAEAAASRRRRLARAAAEGAGAARPPAFASEASACGLS